MSWVMVGVGGAMALKGGLDARAAKKREEKHDNYRKAAIAYSPWTNMGDPGAANVGNTDMLSGAIGGGVQGAALGGMMGGGGGGTFKAAGGGSSEVGANALGGQDMSNKLGQEFGNSFQNQPMSVAQQPMPSASMQAPQMGAASAGALGGKKGVYQNLLAGGDAAGGMSQQFGTMDGMMGQNPNSIYSAFLAQNR